VIATIHRTSTIAARQNAARQNAGRSPSESSSLT